MNEQQEFDFIIKTCVPPFFWDTIDGKPECWYSFCHDSEGYWLYKGSGGMCFGPFDTLDEATEELRKIIVERIDGILSNKEMYLHE